MDIVSLEELELYIKSNILNVHVIPCAKEYKIVLDRENNRIIVRIKEKAEDNKANAGLVYFLKKQYGLNVRIIRGNNSRNKVLCIDEY